MIARVMFAVRGKILFIANRAGLESNKEDAR